MEGNFHRIKLVRIYRDQSLDTFCRKSKKRSELLEYKFFELSHDRYKIRKKIERWLAIEIRECYPIPGCRLLLQRILRDSSGPNNFTYRSRVNFTGAVTVNWHKWYINLHRN